MNKLNIYASMIFTSNNWGDARWLAVLRIGAGVALIAKIIAELRYTDILYGSQGLVPVEIFQFSQNHMIPTLLDIFHALPIVCSESDFLTAYFVFQLLFAAFLILGFMSRLSALICWTMQVVVFNSSHLISYGFDAVLLSLLFYSYIFPVGRYFSIDNRRKPAPYDASILPIYFKVVQLHICIIYFVNGMSKIGGQNWHDGSGIWDAINQPQFESWLTPILQKILMIKYLPQAITWSTIFIEIAYPFMVWGQRRESLILYSYYTTSRIYRICVWLVAFCFRNDRF